MNTIHTKFPIKILKEIAFSMHQGVNTVTESIQYKATGYPIIQSKHITKGFLDLIDTRLVGEFDYQKYQEKYNPRIGDILICNIGTIGKSILIEKENNFIIAWNIFLVRLDNSQVYPNYCKHYLDDLSHKRYFDKFLTGGTVKFVSKGSLGNIEIPLPPIDQQKRIAAILDKAEELRSLRRQSIEQLDILGRSIFIEMFGDPVTNPKGWNRFIFSDLISKIESGHSPNCLDRPKTDQEWGVLKLGAVTWCDYNQSENKALPPHEKPHLELEVKVGDLLFVRKNTYELVAASVLVRSTMPKLLLPDLIFRLRLNSDAPINSCFLHKLLINPSKRREIQKLASGAASSMPNISKAKLYSVLIEVPPLSLQQEFAQRIKAIEHLKSQHRESLAQLDKLFASLQHRAFRGEL
jgi:type I restriction enzyme, S subunit